MLAEETYADAGKAVPMDMKERTRIFSRKTVLFCRVLPDNREGRLIGGQLFRAGTSVGSNYRAACRARSRADFIAKLGIVEEETDECLFWLEMIDDLKIAQGDGLQWLLREAAEILAMTVSSIRTARQNSHRDRSFRTPHSALRT